jgi:hypothetical protein
MHFLYVDESGDVGAKPGSSRHFILCGILVHHADWRKANGRLQAMRERLQAFHGLSLDAELHASEFLSDSSNHLGLTQRQRLQSLLHSLGCIQKQSELTPLCVVVDKGAVDPTSLAWAELTRIAIERIGISGPHADCRSKGLAIICDNPRASPGRLWARETLSAQPQLATWLIDLPFGRESQDSHLLQACDLLCFLMKQSLLPNHFFGTSGGQQLLRRHGRLWTERGLRCHVKG